MPKKAIIAVDIRSSRIVVLAGRLNAKGEIEILWFSESETNILTDGLVTNTKKAAAALKEALSNIRVCFDPDDVSVICNYPGSVKFVKKKATLILDDSRVITEADIARMYSQSPLQNERFIYSTESSYIVDDLDGLRDPVGMIAARIEADRTMISVRDESLQKLLNSFAFIGLSIENFYPCSIAATHAVLHEEEIEDETFSFVVMDTGSASTRITIVQNGRIDNISILKMGGNSITDAICTATGLDFKQAEALKINYGSVLSKGISGNRMLPINYLNGGRGIPLKEDRLAEIIRKNVGQLIGQAWKEARAYLSWSRLPDNIVLTGAGIAKFQGIEVLVKHTTGQKCRIGRAGIGLSADSEVLSKLNSPEYASSIGLLKIKL